jgi:hypothetical protein
MSKAKKLASGVELEAVVIRLGAEQWWVRRKRGKVLTLEAVQEDSTSRAVTAVGPRQLARNLVLFELGRDVLSAANAERDEQRLGGMLSAYFPGGDL